MCVCTHVNAVKRSSSEESVIESNEINISMSHFFYLFVLPNKNLNIVLNRKYRSHTPMILLLSHMLPVTLKLS